MLSNAVHHYIDRMGTKSADTILTAVEPYDVVSFDVFDTVIRRAVSEPEDVFFLLGKKIGEADCEGFKRLRIKAGKEARLKAGENGIQEITMEDIYDCMPSSYKAKKNEIIDEELKIEKQICFPDPVLKKVYDSCVSNNKTIVFITDMYLPKGIIADILSNCGYSTYQKLLVSSEEGKTKRNSQLFKYLLNSCPKNSKIVHIGDNLKSDYLNAKKLGIKAVKIAKHPNRTGFFNAKHFYPDDLLKYKKLRKIAEYHSDPQNTFFYKYGFECMGPVLAGAAVNLHKIIMNGNIDKVFFLARDGYMMMRIYETLYPEDKEITDYLYISRKSVQFPLLCEYKNVQEYLDLNGNKKLWNYKIFCNRIGIDSEKVVEEWKSLGLAENYRFYSSQISSVPQIIDFYNRHKEEVKEKSAQAAKIVSEYLQQMKFTGNIIIVDTGGYGTTQKCLEIFCARNGINASVKGVYLWLFDKPDLDAVAFPYKETTSHGGETQITELPLTAHEGTTEGYKRNEDGRIIPDPGKYEYSEYPEMEKAITDIQNGALKFAAVYKNCIPFDLLTPEVSYANTKRISRKPCLNEAASFGKMIFLSDHQENYLANPKSIAYYIRNIGALKEDFRSANWKVGFLKCLFKLPLPYYSIISWSRSIRDVFKKKR